MSGRSPVSVIVVSRGRPEHLRRCITALGQQYYHPFEVIVVADPDGMSGIRRHPLRSRLKLAEFDEANISKARNVGLRMAAGAHVAFVDDDACAEPTWLERLMAPLADGTADAATGHVLGRNGISLQWGTRYLDREGFHHAAPGEGRAMKLEGTNMAIRADLMRALGGFDERFRFFHDDADLSMRLARLGHITTAVPAALVHHGFAASHLRRANRAPTSLQEIGRSTSLFQAKHGDPVTRAQTLSDRRAEERRRMVGHMISGRAEPRDLRRRLSEFDAGLKQGIETERSGEVAPDGASFVPVHQAAPPRTHKVVFGRSWQKSKLLNDAKGALTEGAVVSVLCLSATGLYHRVRFTNEGVWLQTGGIFGRSTRSKPLFRLHNLRSRVAEEVERIREIRT